MDVAIYSRISTKNHGQDNLNQLRQLRAFCQHQGYRIVDEYVDQASGSRAGQ
jgi:DNA invertase Pin-like site-specific DNA recombinase